MCEIFVAYVATLFQRKQARRNKDNIMIYAKDTGVTLS